MIKVLSSSNKTYCSVDFIVITLLFTLTPVQAGQLSLQIDNDGFFASDGNYTNGLFMAWESKPQLNYHQKTTSNMPLLFQWQHGMRLPVNKNDSAWGVKISQRMWTPSDIGIVGSQSNDRPYVGLFELESHTADYSANFSQKNWLALGIIGPKSRAGKVQTKVHDVTGSKTPQGWEYQVQEQVTAQFYYEVDSLFYRNKKYSGPKYQRSYFTNSQWEVSGFSHLALGNLNTQASLGLLLRWGTRLADTFGRLSSHTGHLGNLTQSSHGGHLITFARLGLGYRFTDLSIEGSVPYESLIEIQHKQAKASLGVTLALDDFAFTWSINTYTRAYQSDIKPWHSYGSITLSCAL